MQHFLVVLFVNFKRRSNSRMKEEIRYQRYRHVCDCLETAVEGKDFECGYL